MKTESIYEYAARITCENYLTRAVITLLVALPFIVKVVMICVNARTEGDIWESVAIYALFGMFWAIPSVVFFKRAYVWHRFGAQRLEALYKWFQQQ